MIRRGTDHSWKIVNFNGDIALYATCKCGFRYCCSSSKGPLPSGGWSFTQVIHTLYPYCPNCGARKKRYNTQPEKINKYSWE